MTVANIYIHPAPPLGKNIADKFLLNDSIYQTGLKIAVFTNDPIGLQSDNESFWTADIPAVLFTEDFKNDRNPDYHTINDKISLFNKSYYHRMSRIAIGTLADFASDSTQVGVNEISLQLYPILIYPNPIETNRFSINHLTGKKVFIRVTNVSGETLIEKEFVPENEIINIHLSPQFSSGLYHIMIIDEDRIFNKRFLKL